MDKINKYLPWTLRIIISGLFLLSAATKMFPLWSFEKQIVDLGLGSWCFAHYFARLIIALEIAIGIGILQGNYLKTFVIPVTFALLAAFCIHLSIEIYKHGNDGNCGCFGQLIKMTPLEAIIKNVITIGMLIYLFFKVKDNEKGKNRFDCLLLIYATSALIMFAVFPFCPCKAEVKTEETAILTDTTSSNSLILPESSETTLDTVKNNTSKNDTVIKAPEEKSPKKVKSIYSKFTTFGNKTVNLDEGKKLLCFFAPGCDHCQAAAKEICVMAKKKGFPEVYIFFMDEEAEKIPDFFKIAECKFPYQILDIPTFFKYLGDAQTPGIRYLWNGNLMKAYEGINDNKFDAKGLVKAIEAKYK